MYVCILLATSCACAMRYVICLETYLPLPHFGFVEFQLSKLVMEDPKLIFIGAHVRLIMRHRKRQPHSAANAETENLMKHKN